MTENLADPNDGSKEENKSVSERVKALSALQKDRFYGIYHRYKLTAFHIIDYFRHKRGPNQWPDFITKSDEANNKSGEQYLYLQALTDAFECNNPSEEFESVLTVQSVRSRFSLPSFTKDVTQSCINEIKRVYLVNETEEGQLVPLIALMVN